jgi:hypothetical protein
MKFMRIAQIAKLVLPLTLLLLTACSSVVAVKLSEPFPSVVYEPRNYDAALIVEPEFSSYIATPNENTSIDIGSSQVELLSKAFRGLFQSVEVVNSRDMISPETQIVIIPSVREVQLSTPSDSYLNVYEVWIKYNLDIETGDGEPIDSWFMPAYGKTPDSMMLSRSDAITEATQVALRDAGAKLLLDFFRIPSVYSWMERQKEPSSP